MGNRICSIDTIFHSKAGTMQIHVIHIYYHKINFIFFARTEQIGVKLSTKQVNFKLVPERVAVWAIPEKVGV